MPRTSIVRELLAAPLTVADGAWATELRARSAPNPAEIANVLAPQLVLALAREYLGAGARILTTNTFSANRWRFQTLGLKHDPLDVCRRGAQLARQAVGDGAAAVAGSIGPSGAILALREADEAALSEAFGQQARALVEGGADLIALETFSDLDEVRLALRAVRQAVDVPIVASMSFDSGPQRTRTMMGVAAEEFATALESDDADAIGCNCGSGIATALPAVVALRASTTRPLWVRPSAGLPDLVDGTAVYPQTADEFGSFVPALIEAGATVIGGCCGAGPEHVRRVAALARARRRRGAAK